MSVYFRLFRWHYCCHTALGQETGSVANGKVTIRTAKSVGGKDEFGPTCLRFVLIISYF